VDSVLPKNKKGSFPKVVCGLKRNYDFWDLSPKSFHNSIRYANKTNLQSVTIYQKQKRFKFWFEKCPAYFRLMRIYYAVTNVKEESQED